MKYKIVSDSASNLVNLDSDIAFESVPLHVIVGDQDFADVNGVDTASMQNAIDQFNGSTSTSCPNAEEWLRAFGEEADVIFCVTITSVLSGSCASAHAAKQMFEELHPDKTVYVIDSLSTGPEMVLIIEKLNNLIHSGKSPHDIYSRINQYMEHIHLFFSLASLNNFARNGRISPILAKGIGVLGIRIIGRAAEGNLKPAGKARGDKKSILQLVNHMKNCGYKNGRVIISHSGNPEAARELKDYIASQFGVFNGIIQENRILCSYYAEPMSLLLGFET